MTYEQAQLYIKIFILQHYDKNIEDVIPEVFRHGKVSDLYRVPTGNWRLHSSFVFWADQAEINRHGKCTLSSKSLFTDDTNFNILDYITLEEET